MAFPIAISRGGVRQTINKFLNDMFAFCFILAAPQQSAVQISTIRIAKTTQSYFHTELYLEVVWCWIE